MVNVASNLTKNERLKILFDGYVEKGIIPKLNEREYETQFKSFKRLRNKNMPYIYNNNHLYKLANSSPKQTQYLLSNKTKGYVVFKVPKKNGGIREINAPSKIIKSLQRWVLDHILYKFNCGDSAHGFVPNRTIYTNAEVHVNQDLVLGIDIKDFFPSIKFKPVYDVFKSAGYTNKMAWNLANLCTYNGKLPQGAPTSPMLSNLVALNLDNEFVKYCARWNFKYSRYADDITISGSYNLPIHKTKLVKIIENAGFTVNSDKTRMFSKGSSQKVTGLVVNDKVSIGRKNKKRLRAIVHNILKNGPIIENRSNHPFFREKIFGCLGHAKSIDPDFANPLIEKLKHLDWKSYDQNMTDLREGELIVRSLEKKKYTVPVDVNQTIESEDAFLQVILDTITELKHYIEDRRWTEPFWNDAHKVMLEGKTHKIPASPKLEPKIQPTIYVFFDRRLRPLGIHVLRETYEGIGTLDFKFLITINGNIPLNICAELKLAHSDKLEHGLITQLPLYLKASPSNSGIYLVMWFKDEKEEYFDEPTNKNKSEMLTYLDEKVKIINENDDFNIESILIDSSIRPSASKS